jgi:hypothetical protein
MDEYYAFRGWDGHGRPTVAKLMDLGIEPEFIAAYEKSLS